MNVFTIRPFSCRQVYSLTPCDGSGATVHRQTRAMADEAVNALMTLDDTGYAGHLTCLLSLLHIPEFYATYCGGGFDPAAIVDFGKSHGIRINRTTAASRDSVCTEK